MLLDLVNSTDGCARGRYGGRCPAPFLLVFSRNNGDKLWKVLGYIYRFGIRDCNKLFPELDHCRGNNLNTSRDLSYGLASLGVPGLPAPRCLPLGHVGTTLNNRCRG